MAAVARRRSDGDRLGAFERSLEVTHHGPWLTAPSLFLEIGSDATMWDHRGAADCLSELLLQSLEQGYTPGDRVVVTLGGGHYAPRANRFGTHVEIGHMLANHSLRFGEDPEDGTWKQAVDAALEATRASYPDARVVVHVERKSFKGPQRRCLLEHLRTSDVPVVHSRMLIETRSRFVHVSTPHGTARISRCLVHAEDAALVRALGFPTIRGWPTDDGCCQGDEASLRRGEWFHDRRAR